MKKSVVVIFHIIFWVTFFFGLILLPPIVTRLVAAEEVRHLIAYTHLIMPIIFYLSYFGIIYLISKKERLLYIVLFFIGLYIIFFYLSNRSHMGGLYAIANCIIWAFWGGLFRFFIDWFKKREIQQQLEEQNLKSEIALLRTQINPHFLFNTLHNIDTLLRKNPDSASKQLIKLSDIMRYMLYNANGDKVLLKHEIKHIENYLSLQELRFKNKKLIKYLKIGEPEELQIAPMLLIPFIENAFKHFKNEYVEDKIKIECEIENKAFTLHCTNSYTNNDINKDETTGIGLDIVKRRLNLIYPGKDNLEIHDKNNIFDVKLTINIDDN